MRADRFKIMHWMNARKLTPEHVAERSGTDPATLAALLDGTAPELSADDAERLCAALGVAPEQIAARAGGRVDSVVMTADQVHATRRPIQRAGIHFYNYYTMAAPPGRVAPVILDILCPSGTLPTLNNGHLEPAITVNLGPGDIHGRWGEDLSPEHWRVLAANAGGPDSWIPGDSYVEPSYCPHTYGLASDVPARIVSYTGASNLAPLLDEMNNWSPPAAEALVADWSSAPAASAALSAVLRRRGHDAATAGKAADVPADAVADFLAGDTGSLTADELRSLGDALGFDHRVLLEPVRRRDAAGKTSLDVDGSRASIRRFASYTVASTASAPGLPDLVGLFVKVDGGADTGAPVLDLRDHGENHYLVTGGDVVLHRREGDGSVASTPLGPDGTAWIAPYVEHGWSGTGTLIKLGSGEHLGYLDLFELSHTFEPGATLRRGLHDAQGWGYEPAAPAKG